MKLYKIIHKQTKLTLREFLKNTENSFKVLGSEFTRKTTDFKHEKITTVLSEKGTPGFGYYVPWEGFALYWLSRDEFEVKLNLSNMDYTL